MKLSRIILVVALSLTTCAVFAQKPTSPVKRLPEIREIVEKKPAKRPKALMKQEKELVGNFCRIPGVTVTTDTSKEVTPSYYMLECEVMNKSYGRFLEDLKAQGRTADYEVAKIHNESGEPFFYSFDEQTGTSYNKKYTQSSDYGLLPVVNVSYEGAQLFCQWLTEKLGNGEWEYRLPTEWEWKWAAHDEKGVAFGGSYDDPGYDIRIDSKQTYGEYSPKIGFRVIAVRK